MFELRIGKTTGGPQRPILAFSDERVANRIAEALKEAQWAILDTEGLAFTVSPRGGPAAPEPEVEDDEPVDSELDGSELDDADDDDF